MKFNQLLSLVYFLAVASCFDYEQSTATNKHSTYDDDARLKHDEQSTDKVCDYDHSTKSINRNGICYVLII